MWKKRPSPGLREINRELDRRRKLAVSAKGRVAMKSPAVQPPPRRSMVLIPSVSPGAATMELANPTGDGVAKKCSTRPLPHRPALAPLATAKAASKKIAYLDMGAAEQRRTAPPRRDPLIPTASTVKVPVVANRGIPKRCSAPPPSPCQSAWIPHAPAATVKLPSSGSSTSEAEYSKKTSSAPIPRRCSSTSAKKGTPVKVRTLLANLPTGERLFFLRNAVAVSDAEDGYIEVLYNGNYPPDDPSRAVRVAMDRIKTMPPTQ
ncbi:hypothetical protein CFC21_010617 [Triticum aestivum]|uniref:Uncharacterized protein n=3 Tax=Triticum aestivum TaxID=4565 RepID=A0A9R1DLL5_WHEAT|nr:hypothetical protein CFC21_010617 [Triticum aestivum]